jgi:hypothetical protein
VQVEAVLIRCQALKVGPVSLIFFPQPGQRPSFLGSQGRLPALLIGGLIAFNALAAEVGGSSRGHIVLILAARLLFNQPSLPAIHDVINALRPASRRQASNIKDPRILRLEPLFLLACPPSPKGFFS